MKNLTHLGRIFFAISMIASGLQQLIQQDFVRLVPKLPAWITHSSAWASVSGAILVIAGVAIAVNRKRRLAAIVLGALFLVMLLLYVPGVLSNPGAGYMWTNPCKTLALLGTCILLAALPADVCSPSAISDLRALPRAWHVSAFLFGIFFVVGGVQHFVYLDFVMQLVPAFVPGHRFWACFTGIALIAGGIGLNFRPVAISAATGSGLMIFLWVVALHIPRAIAAPQDAGETSAIFEALALSGGSFLLAGLRTITACSSSIDEG